VEPVLRKCTLDENGYLAIVPLDVVCKFFIKGKQKHYSKPKLMVYNNGLLISEKDFKPCTDKLSAAIIDLPMITTKATDTVEQITTVNGLPTRRLDFKANTRQSVYCFGYVVYSYAKTLHGSMRTAAFLS
jgi:hypothetical protein